MNNNIETPAGWVSTFGLYNAGLLVGYWANAGELPETVEAFAAELKKRGEWSREIGEEIGEELHCFDVEHIPGGNREMSPAEVNAYGVALTDAIARIDEDIDGELLAALITRAASNAAGTLTPANLEDALIEASEQHLGEYDNLEDWAYDYLEETGQLNELPEWARVYAGTLAEAFARDAEVGGEVSIVGGHVWGNA